jgi:hypothetical protein
MGASTTQEAPARRIAVPRGPLFPPLRALTTWCGTPTTPRGGISTRTAGMSAPERSDPPRLRGIAPSRYASRLSPPQPPQRRCLALCSCCCAVRAPMRVSRRRQSCRRRMPSRHPAAPSRRRPPPHRRPKTLHRHRPRLFRRRLFRCRRRPCHKIPHRRRVDADTARTRGHARAHHSRQ